MPGVLESLARQTTTAARKAVVDAVASGKQASQGAVRAILDRTIAAASSGRAGVIKRRAAVVAHDGFAAIDTAVRLRPTIFAGALAGAGVSAWMLYRRRGHGAEALTVWGLATAGFLGVALLTRPGDGGAAVPGAAPEAGDGSGLTARVNRWLDARAARLDRSEPGWDDVALRRVLRVVS